MYFFVRTGMSQYEQIGVDRGAGGVLYEGARQSPGGGHSPMHGHHLPQQSPHRVKELEEARQRIAQMEKTMRSVKKSHPLKQSDAFCDTGPIQDEQKRAFEQKQRLHRSHRN